MRSICWDKESKRHAGVLRNGVYVEVTHPLVHQPSDDKVPRPLGGAWPVLQSPSALGRAGGARIDYTASSNPKNIVSLILEPATLPKFKADVPAAKQYKAEIVYTWGLTARLVAEKVDRSASILLPAKP